jgi:hypothetical protein
VHGRIEPYSLKVLKLLGVEVTFKNSQVLLLDEIKASPFFKKIKLPEHPEVYLEFNKRGVFPQRLFFFVFCFFFFVITNS